MENGKVLSPKNQFKIENLIQIFNPILVDIKILKAYCITSYEEIT